MALYLEALEEHRDELDSLNVFPVPDGDTGTNLLLTHRAIERALQAAEPDDRPAAADLGPVRDTIVRSSLLAARGNSGVILAQVLSGVCETLLAAGSVQDGRMLADAIGRASADAYRAVGEPKEGTVLTVLREAADAGLAAAALGSDAGEVADALVRVARASLERTRGSLPETARAGVVDAGALGIVLLLDSLRAAIRGSARTVDVGPLGPVGAGMPGNGLDATAPGFEVRFVVSLPADLVSKLSEELAGLGDSLTVAGRDGAQAFHVHTNEPARALAAARRAGATRAGSVTPLGGVVPNEHRSRLVAVTDGPGLAHAFGSLGAVVLMAPSWGQPSKAELSAATDGWPGVVVLTGGPDAEPASDPAPDRPDERWVVVVVRAPSIPAALAAATAFEPALHPEANVAAMTEAAALVASGEVDGVTAADDVDRALALVRLLRREVPQAELVTVVLGDGTGGQQDDPVVAALRAQHADVRVHPIDGGQARPRYAIGVE